MLDLDRPVPTVTYAEGGRVARLGPPSEEANRAVFSSENIASPCRRVRGSCSTRECLRCEFLIGLGVLDVSVTRTMAGYRIECGHPVLRPLVRSTEPTHPAVCSEVDSLGIKALSSIFARKDASVVVGCPMARAATGSWLMRSPPCPTCGMFRGVVRTGGLKVLGITLRCPSEVAVQCGAPHQVQVRSMASGATLLRA
jgi:hypothetical protein